MSHNIDLTLVERAWKVRKDNFPPLVFFHYPFLTRPVSVTGHRCELQCAHCGGRFLKNMTSLHRLEDSLNRDLAAGKKIKSCLVSGGCDINGTVPYVNHLEQLGDLKAKYNLRLNFHPGLAGEEEARALSSLADVVSFDFIGDNGTIEKVLGLSRTTGDYAESYVLLKKYSRVIPHICIGLDGGEIAGEYAALEKLAGLGVEGLVFLVLIPAPGTKFENITPPPLASVVNLMAWTRLKLPRVPIHLGCMRPGGKYRRELDYWAVRCGLNCIVMPAPEAKRESRDSGLEIYNRNECCAL